jgi:hypothetical protein
MDARFAGAAPAEVIQTAAGIGDLGRIGALGLVRHGRLHQVGCERQFVHGLDHLDFGLQGTARSRLCQIAMTSHGVDPMAASVRTSSLTVRPA